MRRSPLAFLCIPIALLAACSPGDRSGAAGGANGGTLVIAAGGDADVLLSPISASETGHQVGDLIYDHLAEIGDGLNTIGDGGFTPRLASSWTWAPDSLSIAFHLDPRARWHVGQPVRASDVRFSVALQKDPNLASQTTPLIANVDSATVRDSLTAVVWLHARRPEAFYDIAYQIVILPEHLLKDIPPDKLATSDAARKPVGSGRFRFVSWTPGSRIEVVADTTNYRGRAKLDRVIWSITPDNQAALTQVLAGQADLMENLAPDQVTRLNADPAVRAFPYPGLIYGVLGLNERTAKAHAQPHPLFADVRMRRAISMGLDRRAMLHNVFDTLGHIGYGPFPRSHATADTTLRLPPYDVAHARALLDSLGWIAGTDGIRMKAGRPLAFSVLVPTSSKIRMTYAVLIQDQLKAIGVKMDVDAMAYAQFQVRFQARDFDALLQTYSTDPSAGGAVQYWGSEGARPGGTNFFSYMSPHFDALLDTALNAFDPIRAKQYTAKAYQVAADDAPAVWLYDVLTLGAINKRIQTPGLRADAWWANLADWSIPATQRIDRDRIGLRSQQP